MSLTDQKIGMVSITTCDSDFIEIGKRVLQGALVVFPTDTVFGVGSSPMSVTGVRKCFEIKRRVVEKKLPVLFPNKSDAETIVAFNETSRLIADSFWPGPLTLILPIKRGIAIPEELIGSEHTLAVRVPDHDCCRRLIAACGNCLIGTSANFSGVPPATDPSDPSLLDFAAHTDYFVKGNCGEGKLPSTILDLSVEKEIRILRDGAIPKKEISDYLEKINVTDFSIRMGSS